MDRINIDGILFGAIKGKLRSVILSGNNLEKELNALSEYNLDEIWINRFFCSDRIPDLDFLKDCPKIKSVNIVDDDFDCKGLLFLPKLARLSISGNSFTDYSVFPSLQYLAVIQEKISALPSNLTELHICGVKFRDNTLSSLDFPQTLRSLHLTRSNIVSLIGLPPSIEDLQVNYTRSITSLVGIDSCANNLHLLELDHCPNLTAYTLLESCVNMEKLLITSCGDMPNVEFVRRMPHLGHFAFYGTYVRNNDLLPIMSIPSVFFRNNKSYNYRLKDFDKRSR